MRFSHRAFHGLLKARRCTAAKCALHFTHATANCIDGMARAALGFLLKKINAHIKRDRIKAAGQHNARAALFGLAIKAFNHIAHPRRLSAKIDIIRAVRDAGPD